MADYRACVALQRATWGQDFSERAPPTVLMAAQEVGGVAAGAFAADGELLGFVFGLTGIRDGALTHWSDMLAVRPGQRGHGVGTRLKWYQRQLLLPLGVELVLWTFDPLESRNAYLNFVHLGAHARVYRRDLYGESDSVLHQGIGTDRLIAEWHLRAEGVETRAAGGRPAAPEPGPGAPVVNPVRGSGASLECDEPVLTHDAPAVLIAVPSDIQSLKAAAPDRAMQWRRRTRSAFEHYLGRGYRAVWLVRRGEWSGYLLSGDS